MDDVPVLTEIPEINQLIFPEIVEDPFIYDVSDYYFPIVVRAETASSYYLYNAEIKMNQNPFLTRQFAFKK